MFHIGHGPYIQILSASIFAFIFTGSLCVSKCNSKENDQREGISIHGAVNNSRIISFSDLKAFSPFHINNVSMLKEKDVKDQKEEIIGVFNYTGILLRDILEKAGMKYKRKWEPLVFIRVRGSKGKEVVFSFGEIFYSSIGRSILIAYEKNGKPITFYEGCGELIVATDIRCGRRIREVREVIVERVDIAMHSYNDKKHNIVRPPSEQLLLVDRKSTDSRSITAKDLESLPMVLIPNAVMTGDCEGFNGVFSFEGPSLKILLKKFGIKCFQKSYARYVAISSEDGFSAVFSFGEIFNSRLSNNIIIAVKKNGAILDSRDGFAMSIVGEDSTGGRSVKRIRRVEIF